MSLAVLPEEDEQKIKAVEPERVTLEVFFEAMKALQHLQQLTGALDDDLRRSVEMALRIVTVRRVVCALDRASGTPLWWQVNRIRFFCPEMTAGAIAEFLNIKKNQVTHYIKHVEIPESVYDDLPALPK